MLCDTYDSADGCSEGGKRPLGSLMVSNSGSFGDGLYAREFGDIERPGTSLSVCVRSSHLVLSENSSSVARLSTLARWTTLNSNFDCLSHQHRSFALGEFIVGFQQRGSWSIRILNTVPSRKKRRRYIPYDSHTSPFVLARCFSLSFRFEEQ